MMERRYPEATQEDIDRALQQAAFAFQSYRHLSAKSRAAFLREIAVTIEALGNELLYLAMEETALPEPRIKSERARTVGHLRMFADYIEQGWWVQARIDTALPGRMPSPRPDLRKMLVPIGPVVVFGASNFPLAYSTAGGDTVSALAAGCPVIVKAHPAHAHTSQMVADAIEKAVAKTGMPVGVFHHFHGASFDVGQKLVHHPLTKAVGFTGSFTGGKALFDLANQRKEPIPVFAEMGSTNPVIMLPATLQKKPDEIASRLAASMVLSVGQFCTNPGLLIGIENEGLDQFVKALASRINAEKPATMLHAGIAENFHKNLTRTLAQKGINVVAEGTGELGQQQAKPVVAKVSAAAFLENPVLADEVFGPFSLLICCRDRHELHQVATHLHGQLTATVVGDDDELKEYQGLIRLLTEKAGRIIINGVPTGVEVSPAMHHGGPFPATTDSRFTSVGTDAIERFARPVVYQNCPDGLLPDELKESNPLGIWRLYNGEWKK